MPVNDDEKNVIDRNKTGQEKKKVKRNGPDRIVSPPPSPPPPVSAFSLSVLFLFFLFASVLFPLFLSLSPFHPLFRSLSLCLPFHTPCCLSFSFHQFYSIVPFIHFPSSFSYPALTAVTSGPVKQAAGRTVDESCVSPRDLVPRLVSSSSSVREAKRRKKTNPGPRGNSQFTIHSP